MARNDDYEAPGFFRTLAIEFGLARSRVEKGNYNFSGSQNDPEWERFKRDSERDKIDGFGSR